MDKHWIISIYICNHFIATKKESEIRKFSWPVFQGYVRESPHKIGQTYGTVPQLYGLEIPTDIFIQLISMDIAAIIILDKISKIM